MIRLQWLMGIVFSTTICWAADSTVHLKFSRNSFGEAAENFSLSCPEKIKSCEVHASALGDSPQMGVVPSKKALRWVKSFENAAKVLQGKGGGTPALLVQVERGAASLSFGLSNEDLKNKNYEKEIEAFLKLERDLRASLHAGP